MVKRYDIADDDDSGDVSMMEFENGEYVTFADYDSLSARLAATEENLERETALLTEARQQNADLMAIIDKRDEALGFIPLDKGMDMQDELRETKARLAEAERLLQEVRPMVQSYRRKHEKAFDAASRKLFTELAEKHAETMGKCDRILAAIGTAVSAPIGGSKVLVKRFSVYSDADGGGRYECHDGDFVLASDYAEAELDAARYRWLRDRAWPFEFKGDTPEDADAAIDAAMHLAARPAAAKKHTPECSYWDGLMAQVCNCGLTERCCLDYPRCDCNSPPEPDDEVTK